MVDRSKGADVFGDDRSKFNDYAYLVEQAEDGLYMLDEDGTFELVNEAFTELTGYEREELIGTDVRRLLSGDDYRNINDEIRSARRSSTDSGSFLTTFETKSGQKKPVEIRFSLLPTGENSEYKGLTGVARDVRARRHREQKLDVLSRVLRHNVRNKINLIVGHASVIEGADDEQYTRAAGKIEAAADDLMDLSEKARTAQTEVSFNPSEDRQADLVALLQHVAVQFRRDYPAARVVTDLPEELPANTSKSYRIAVSELVENAIEHNPGDESVVRIRLTSTDAEIRTVIEDNCPPIPETERRAINEGQETPLMHSLGIGLWLANWVADTLGGELQFERLLDDSGNRATLVLHHASTGG
jgi:PAS domain S-box-containing protein